MGTKFDKIRRAADRFNRERAAKGIGYIMRGKKIIGFRPCEKALVFLAGLPGTRPPALTEPPYNRITAQSVLSEIENLAALTICECHPGMTSIQIMAYEYEEAK